jgi:hypothetical protein
MGVEMEEPEVNGDSTGSRAIRARGPWRIGITGGGTREGNACAAAERNRMWEEKKLPRVVGYREKKTLKTGRVRRGRADRCEDGWPGYGIVIPYPVYKI